MHMSDVGYNRRILKAKDYYEYIHVQQAELDTPDKVTIIVS